MTPLGYIFAIEPPCWVCRRPSEVSVTIEGERREVCGTCWSRAEDERNRYEDTDDDAA